MSSHENESEPSGRAGRAGPSPRKRRAPKAVLRGAAWAAAGASVVAPGMILSGAPWPAAAAGPAHRRVIIVQRITRRIVIDAPTVTGAPSGATSSAPQIHYVYVGGGTVSAGGGSTTTTRCSTC